MKGRGLLKFLISIAVACALIAVPGLLMGKPVPASLAKIYIFFTAVVALLVITSTDKGLKGLTAPLNSLAEDVKFKGLRYGVLLIVPLFFAYLAYHSTEGDTAQHSLTRVVHPPPPSYFKAYGKRIKPSELENPFRSLEKEDPQSFEKFVKEGGNIYFNNCFFCHGAALDGKGHYAHALSPKPQPFTGTDTIAQLSESYIFWRIVTGGPGLPREAAPERSSMPAWEEDLSEEEVWKVILFLYDQTGNRPRSWE